MSLSLLLPQGPHRRGGPATRSGTRHRRVRHEVKDGVVVVVFSAAASTALALALLALTQLAGLASR